MKRSLLINAVDPAVGGVILLGDRGTGKSIAVKAMADIMPVCLLMMMIVDIHI